MDLSFRELILLAIAFAISGSIIFTLIAAAILNYLHKTSKKHLPKDANSWVEISDSKIHYRIDGKGPVLVLIHGLGASLFIWRLISARLAQRFTVLTFDLPGFGLSSKNSALDYGLDDQARRIIEALDALQIEEATLVGSSMGGTLALWLARENPKRFKNVIALAPATSPSLVPRFVLPFNNALKNLAPLLHRTMNTHTMKLVASLVLHDRSLLTEETINAYLRPWLEDKESINTFWRAIELVRDRRLPHELDKVTSRVLVLWGERDRVVPRRCISELIDILPYADFRVHKDCGHHPMEDQPDWVIVEVERFLRVKNP